MSTRLVACLLAVSLGLLAGAVKALGGMKPWEWSE